MEQFYTIKRAARYLEVSEKFLRKLQRRGRLRVVRLGRTVRIARAEIERLIRDGSVR